MGLTISVHAKGQAKKRGIAEAGIRNILASSKFLSIPSVKDPEAAIVLGKHEGRIWGVVLNVNTRNVITVRLASRKERRLYEEKIWN
jgi:uncharacterized DUF497 family protein